MFNVEHVNSTVPRDYMKSFIRACLHGGGGPQVGEVTCGGSPHLSCKHDQIKVRACLHGVGDPGLVGLVSFVFTLWGTQNKRNLPY